MHGDCETRGMTEEHFFPCPCCNARISVLVDCSQKRQDYIEDCEVCCRPLPLLVRCSQGRVREFDASES